MRAMFWVGVAGAALLLIFIVWLAARTGAQMSTGRGFHRDRWPCSPLITLLTVLRDSEEERRFVS